MVSSQLIDDLSESICDTILYHVRRPTIFQSTQGLPMFLTTQTKVLCLIE